MKDFTMDERVELFRQSAFLKGLPLDTILALAKVTEHVKYPKGTIITRNGELNTTVYFVICGVLKVSACSKSGKRLTFLLVKKGEPYNLMSPYMQYPRFLEAEVMRDARCLLIKGDVFRTFVEQHPEITPNIIEWIGIAFDSANSRILDMMEKKVEIRIMRVLATLYDKFDMPLHFTSVEISELAGTTPESTLRAMGILRDMGVIETGRGKIWIKNAEMLRDAVEQNIRV